MRLAMTGMFRARWSDAIHDEWTSAVARNRPDLTGHQLRRTRDLMDKHVPECLVTGFEGFIPGLRLPDANDRHVLAAAIMTKAGAIVTFNLKDFPADALAPFGIEAQHPDEFVEHLIDLDAPTVLDAVRRHRASLTAPSYDAETYIDIVQRQRLPRVAQWLRANSALI